MTGEGIVISASGSEAVVKIFRSSACGHDCASCKACSNPSYEMKVANPISAKAGDRVVIESNTSVVLGLSFLLYILPVFVLIASALLCEAYSLGLYSIPVFICLLGLWFFFIRLINKRLRPQNVITALITSED